MKPRINSIVVVEGKTDTEKLKKIFDVQTFETNGSDITKQKIELLKTINSRMGIILFLDPDQVGKKIRSQILEKIPNAMNAYLPSNTKGVAEHKEIEILEAFKNFFSEKKEEKNTINWKEYLELNLSSKQAREKVCNKLKIPYCNNKSLFKTINMIGVTKKYVQEIIIDENNKK